MYIHVYTCTSENFLLNQTFRKKETNSMPTWAVFSQWMVKWCLKNPPVGPTPTFRRFGRKGVEKSTDGRWELDDGPGTGKQLRAREKERSQSPRLCTRPEGLGKKNTGKMTWWEWPKMKLDWTWILNSFFVYFKYFVWLVSQGRYGLWN